MVEIILLDIFYNVTGSAFGNDINTNKAVNGKQSFTEKKQRISNTLYKIQYKKYE